MATYIYNIDALNAIAVAKGGTGGHALNINALNEWCARLGGNVAFTQKIDALNDIAVRLGGSGGHRFNINALNEIATKLGGAGGHTLNINALNEIFIRVGTGGVATTGYVLDGDSITHGYGLTLAEAYPAQLAALTGLQAVNLGIDARTLGTMNNVYATNAGPQYNAASRNTLVVYGGANDIHTGTSAATLQTTVQAYCAKARTTGYKVFVCTIIPNAVILGAEETARVTFNTWLVANWATFADGLVDFAARSEFASTSNRTYFQADGRHPTAAGQALMAELIRVATGVAKDTTAPVITVSASQTVAENSAFFLTLTANETVTWTKTGGADAARFTLSGATLSMAAKDYEAPADANGDNVYEVQVTATDAAGNTSSKVIFVTVTDVTETPPSGTRIDDASVRIDSTSVRIDG